MFQGMFWPFLCNCSEELFHEKAAVQHLGIRMDTTLSVPSGSAAAGTGVQCCQAHGNIEISRLAINKP